MDNSCSPSGVDVFRVLQERRILLAAHQPKGEAANSLKSGLL